MATTRVPGTTGATGTAPRGIDPRGPRFAAGITAVVLAVAVLTGSVWVLAFQTLVFGIGYAAPAASPYGWLYRTLVRPRLGPPAELEDPAPPRFAQAVGLGFAVVGLAGFLLGADLLGLVATGFALVAALLNAVFGFCLGCEMYLLIKRLTGPRVVPVRAD